LLTAAQDTVAQTPTDDNDNTQRRLLEESEELRLLFKAAKPRNTKKSKHIEGQLDLFSMLDAA
jgi:hypothetical protein